MPGAARAPLSPVRATRDARSRGLTLIEVIVVVAIGALLMGAILFGAGAATNAKLKAATTVVSSAIRTAYTRSSAVSKPHRVVFEFSTGRFWIEEGAADLLVQSGDAAKTGGADPATEAEKRAAAETERIRTGPRPPRVAFKPVKGVMVSEDDKGVGMTLGANLRFREVMTAHQTEPLREGRAYLYTWPGGTTELAYIQIAKGKEMLPADTMTLTVHPLTGKVRIVPGAKTIRTDEAESEREDRGW